MSTEEKKQTSKEKAMAALTLLAEALEVEHPEGGRPIYFVLAGITYDAGKEPGMFTTRTQLVTLPSSEALPEQSAQLERICLHAAGACLASAVSYDQKRAATKPGSVH